MMGTTRVRPVDRVLAADSSIAGAGAMGRDEQAIRNVVARWHKATADGDVGAVLALMADDVVFLVAGKPPMRGREAFERGLRTLLASHRIESTGEIQEVEVDGNLAYCWATLDVRIVPLGSGAATTRNGNTLSIFRRQTSGDWVLYRDANLLPTA